MYFKKILISVVKMVRAQRRKAEPFGKFHGVRFESGLQGGLAGIMREVRSKQEDKYTGGGMMYSLLMC